MPIRHLAIALPLAIAACAVSQAPPPDTTTEIEGEVRNRCNPQYYPCDPNDHFSNGICEWVCGAGNPGDGYCQPHRATEDIWCELHPDTFITLDKYCDLWGNATWWTRCMPGATP